MTRITQINLNRSKAAQDLLIHNMIGGVSGLAAISEPFGVLRTDPRWFYSSEGRPDAAIFWLGSCDDPPCVPLDRGPGFVAVTWGELIIFSCYSSPNDTLCNFKNLLSNLDSVLIKSEGKPSLILGDFNARSRAWDEGASNVRGGLLSDWMITHGFSLLNTKGAHTCVRFQGSSAVDTSWASRKALQWILNWRVRAEDESLSDHLYIHIEILVNKIRKVYRYTKNIESSKYLKEIKNSYNMGWNIKKLNEDFLETAVIFESWARNTTLDLSADEKIGNIERILKRACELSMPKKKKINKKKSYWWSEELASLRRICIKNRRKLTIARQKDNHETIIACRERLREDQRVLRSAIRKSKKLAWREQLKSLNEDPWGLPFKIVMGKIKPSVPSVTETLPEKIVENIVHTLFPGDRREENAALSVEWDPQSRVTADEIRDAVSRIGGIRKAPGPDGINGRIIKLTTVLLMDLWSDCLTACLSEGLFPTKWKIARMVLLKKGEELSLDPKNYRPICLLNEMAKLFERILVSRLNAFIDSRGILSPKQFGFRAGCSTVDAILKLKDLTQAKIDKGRTVVAVSLDISNAFNSIPWSTIVDALVEADFPNYLVRILKSYLSDRMLLYTGRYGQINVSSVYRGVPQGSALGPTLWNIAYDRVLRVNLPEDCSVLGYADDTVLLAAADGAISATLKANRGLQILMRVVDDLGLTLAANKTRAMIFSKIKKDVNMMYGLEIGNVWIPIKDSFKYLGMIVDGNWSFYPHAEYILKRAERTFVELIRLMPNLHGPAECKRKLYSNVIHSILLYGSPVWYKEIRNTKKLREKFQRTQRRLALRVICAYRTVSGIAALILARIIPFEMQAKRLGRVYLQIVDERANGIHHSIGDKNRMANLAMKEALRDWENALLNCTVPVRCRVRSAILPHFKGWFGRSHGNLNYHTTQMITGHGCFNSYLFRFGNSNTPACAHCGFIDDTAQHVLESCPEWREEREKLVETIGTQLDMGTIIRSIIESKDKWNAFSVFCNKVLSDKERAERIRQQSIAVP